MVTTGRQPVTTPAVHPPPTTDEGDHDRFAHYVPEKQLALSRRYGTPVRALCGKRWVPTADPSRYPMCPTCAEIVAEAMGRSFQD